MNENRDDAPPSEDGRGRALDAEKTRGLLVEWREALVQIVEEDPDAVETKRKIADIDEELARLPGSDDGDQT